jgi:hypothetical protein
MPYFEEAGNDITSGYVTQFMEDAAYNDLDYYSLKREIFDLQWFKK